MNLRNAKFLKKSKPRGSLYVAAGPSGVGKNTLIKHALDIDKHLSYISSLTTRPMRTDESQGHPYHFVSKQEFSQKIKNDELLEWQYVNENFYGSSKKRIEKALSNSEDIITDLEVLGVHELVLKLPTDICTIFIAPPSNDELIKRINKRHREKPSEIDIRMRRVDFEFSLAVLFDYLIYNENLETAVEEVVSIIKAHRAQKKLNEIISDQGDAFILRTVRFKLLNNNNQHFTKGKNQNSLELPKTKLSKYETIESALKRLIRIINFKSSTQLDTKSFFVINTSEELIDHKSPSPYIELKNNCYIGTNSQGDRNKLIKALDLIEQLKSS